MNQELLKKLKDAGYPVMMQSWVKAKPVIDWSKIESGDVIKIETEEQFIPPTLSELIEACGENNEHGEFTLWFDLEEWVAGYYEDFWGEPRKHNKTRRGSTPEEAVANLWLELNKAK
jgi:hypothetical protein